MKNKKKLILLIIGIALIVFVSLYMIINYNESTILNSQDKKWISDNGGKVIDIDVVNDIPIYSAKSNINGEYITGPIYKLGNKY